MNSKNALVLIALGAAMRLVPVEAPGWFPPTGFDGSNAQALWLTAMGWIQFATGALYLIRHYVVPRIPRWEGAQAPRGNGAGAAGFMAPSRPGSPGSKQGVLAG